MPSNRFFLLRHGHSQANAEGLICSDPARGRITCGLTDTGRQQVRQTAEAMQSSGPFSRNTVIVTSPFLRALQTAQMVAEVLGVPTLDQDDRLRERFFGDLEGQTDTHYPEVWKADEVDFKHQRWGVESAAHVAKRTLALWDELDGRFVEKVILLVAHGDVCSILLSAVKGQDVGRHHPMNGLDTAKLRDAGAPFRG